MADTAEASMAVAVSIGEVSAVAVSTAVAFVVAVAAISVQGKADTRLPTGARVCVAVAT